jgi:hypothetical protein
MKWVHCHRRVGVAQLPWGLVTTLLDSFPDRETARKDFCLT